MLPAAVQELKRAKTERSKRVESAKMCLRSGSVPTSQAGSSIPSALTTNSQWYTELSDTFMGTMCHPDMPSPEASALTTTKLDFLHAQLNGFTKDAVVLERFNLLGPNQRRQGGAQPGSTPCPLEAMGAPPTPPPPCPRPGRSNRCHGFNKTPAHTLLRLRRECPGRSAHCTPVVDEGWGCMGGTFLQASVEMRSFG